MSQQGPTDSDTGQGQAVSSVQVEPCYLLKLPQEMKDKIYQYTLVSPLNIQVTSTGYSMNSGLLGTCKEIRSGARPIFYQTNTFEVHIRNYNPTPMMHWFELRRQALIPVIGTKYLLVLHYEPRWANLMRWLENCHAGKCISARSIHREMGRPLNPWGVSTLMVGGMFEAAWRMQQLPWPLVKAVLDIDRAALVLLDRRWAL